MGRPSSTTATQELVVPRSIPITLPTAASDVCFSTTAKEIGQFTASVCILRGRLKDPLKRALGVACVPLGQMNPAQGRVVLDHLGALLRGDFGEAPRSIQLIERKCHAGGAVVEFRILRAQPENSF